LYWQSSCAAGDADGESHTHAATTVSACKVSILGCTAASDYLSVTD